MPTLVAEIGIGAMLPVLALSVVDMGHSVAFGSLAVAAYQLGRLPGSALGGALVHRLGAAHAALTALAVLGLGAVVTAIEPDLAVFMIGAVLVGLGHASYHVARQEQTLAVVSRAGVARSLTTLAGVWRIGNFIGPLLGSVVIAVLGLSATYWLGAGCIVLAMALLALVGMRGDRRIVRPSSRVAVRDVIREQRHVLSTLGVTVVATGALRQARIAVVPLWASHVGLDPEVATLVFSISAGIDMLLFYPAGAVMDRKGRLWTAIPSTLVLALGFLALPLTDGVAQVTAVALVLGIGNGWGSGLVMTLGADVAPEHGRSVFTGVWMVLQDVGGLAGPAIVSAGAMLALPVGLVAVGGIGLAATAGFAAWVPRTRPAHAHRVE
ncbi:MFS transporter [Demequina mangrovi]|uniref:Predicted arabinose efflux permease, MFS family n=1 Tax=Demequina mangrovi TaxID=1043493 RepID=A0A1H6YN29_9MICO|nr:MFS transporter [Demequina mangrovi]SEJ38135.1 Predicted arabinose efflux permease, MFS family [Demequina mangrovi]